MPGALPSDSKPQHQPHRPGTAPALSTAQPWATRDIHSLAPIVPGGTVTQQASPPGPQGPEHPAGHRSALRRVQPAGEQDAARVGRRKWRCSFREQISTIPEIPGRFREAAGIPGTGVALPSPDGEGAQRRGDVLCWRLSNGKKGGKKGIAEIQHSLRAKMRGSAGKGPFLDVLPAQPPPPAAAPTLGKPRQEKEEGRELGRVLSRGWRRAGC